MKADRIIQRVELAPLDGETPGKPAMLWKRRFKLKTVAYRYPVEQGMASMLWALRDRIGADDMRQHLGPKWEPPK
jgi:hypothetical protein